MESILLSILGAVAPALAVYLVTQLAKLLPAIDRLPGLVKQILVVVEAYLFALLGGALGIQLPADLASFGDPVVMQTAITAILSWLIHKFFAPKVVA